MGPRNKVTKATKAAVDGGWRDQICQLKTLHQYMKWYVVIDLSILKKNTMKTSGFDHRNLLAVPVDIPSNLVRLSLKYFRAGHGLSPLVQTKWDGFRS
jgi:hypothetical protein